MNVQENQQKLINHTQYDNNQSINFDINCLEFHDLNLKIECKKCKQGYYIQQEDQLCYKCSDKCQECISIDNCIDKQNTNYDHIQQYSTNKSEFIKNKLRNLVTCNSDEFLLNNECKKCNSSCKACTISEKNCTDCPDDKFLSNFQCLDGCAINQFAQGKICKETCDDGYYIDYILKKCIKCPELCLTCSNQYSCIDCKKGTIFYDGKCLTKCPQSYYESIQSSYSQCQKCKQNCKVCTNDLNCSECKLGYYLDATTQSCLQCASNCKECKDADTCKSCITQLNTCLEDGQCSMPQGYNYDKSCTDKCPDNCKKCTKDGCIECFEKYFLINNIKGINECQSCHNSCLNCTGQEKNECTQCSSGYLYYRNQCLEECPQGTYANSDKACILCSSSLFCSTCISASECGSCIYGYYLYEDPITKLKTCKKCNSKCRTCTGPNDSDCTPCFDGTSACNNCNDGYFQDGTLCFTFSYSKQCSKSTKPNYNKRVCESCPSNCLTCNQQKCTSCIDDRYYLTLEGSCNTCSSSNTGMQNCLRCSNYNTCTVCNDKYRLNQQTGECIQYCPPVDGYYQKDSKTCDICPTGCSQCSLLNTFLQCTSCREGYFLNTGTKKCDACNSNCLICQSASSCIKCKIAFYLMPTTQQCLNVCKSGYYAEEISRQCIKCSLDKCTSCKGPYECLECAENNYLDKIDKKCYQCANSCKLCTDKAICTLCESDKYLSQNPDGSVTCVNYCENTQYISFEQISNLNPEIQKKTCANCSKQCEFCFSNERCLSCRDGYYLKINTDDANNSSCEACSSECLTCDGPLVSQCFTCKADYYYFQKTCLTLQQCEQKNGYFADTTKNLCSTCYPLCSTCKSKEKNECKTCKDGYYLSKGSCLLCDKSCKTCLTSSTSCTSCSNRLFLEVKDEPNKDSPKKCISADASDKCLDGYYKDYFQSQCSKCVEPCINCTGSTIYECTSCLSGYYLQLKGIVKCVKCDSNCDKCHSDFNSDTQLDEYACDACSNGYFKTDSTQKSCKKCDTDKYSINNVCKDCSKLCATCLAEKDTDCTSCPDKQYVQGTQININGSIVIKGKCANCFRGCLKCNSDSENDCLQCVQGYYFFNKQCYLTCPYGLQPDSKSNCTYQIEGCLKWKIDETLGKAVCEQCSNPLQFLHEQNCKDTCPDTLLKNLITRKCVTECTSDEYFSPDLNECSLDCLMYSYIDSNTNKKMCQNNCPDGYYKDEVQSNNSQAKRQCFLCDPKCSTCTGKTNSECKNCSFGSMMHESTNLCNDFCDDGYIPSVDRSQCLICIQDCSSCKNGLVLYINQCLQKCPFGFKKQDNINRCIVQYEQSVEILNEEQFSSEGVSPFTDLRIEAILINIDPDRIISAEWKLESSTDYTIQQLFIGDNDQIFKYSLILYISQKFLRGYQKHIFVLEVILPLNKTFMKKVVVNMRKEMVGGKFNLNPVSQDINNPLNNFYTFTIGYFETSRKDLFFRITCENLQIFNDIYQVSTKKILVFDDVMISQITYDSSTKTQTDDSFLTTTDQFAFPILNTEQIYICSILVRGVPSLTDTISQKMQEDKAILFEILKVPSLESGNTKIESLIKQIVTTAETNPEKINKNQWIQMVYSLDHVIFQFKPEDIANKIMTSSLSIELKESNSPTIEQTNQVWAGMFPNCKLLLGQNNESISCKCDSSYFGLFCQYDSQNQSNQLLLSLQKVMEIYIPSSLSEISQNFLSPVSMEFIPIIRKVLEYKINFSNLDTVTNNILNYFNQILITRNADQIGDFVHDIHTILDELEIFVKFSQFTIGPVRKSTIDLLNNQKNKWNLYLTKYSNLGEGYTFYGSFTQTDVVTIQQSRQKDKRVSVQQNLQTYLSISFNEQSIEIPPQIVLDWNSITIIQRIKAFLPTKKSSVKSILLSPIYEIDLYSKESVEKINYYDLEQPLLISLKLSAPLQSTSKTNLSELSFECVFFDETIGDWSTQGLQKVQVKNSDTVVCSTTHLSVFAIRKVFPSPAFKDSGLIDSVALSSRLPPKRVTVTSIDEQKAGQKSVPLQEWIKTSLIEGILQRNGSRKPYYIDSFIEVTQKNINVLSHLTFPGIIPFRYPDRFINPFGLYILIILVISLVLTILLVRFQIALVISKIIQYIIKRKKQNDAEKKEKKKDKVKDLNKQKSKKLEKEDKKKKKDKESLQESQDPPLPTEGIVLEVASQNSENPQVQKDLAFLNRIKKNIHLMYQSGNLGSPTNSNQPEQRSNDEESMFEYVGKHQNKNQNQNQNQGFGEFVDKRNKEEKSDHNFFRNIIKQQVGERTMQRKGSVLSVYSNSSRKGVEQQQQRTKKRHDSRKGSIAPKGQAAPYIWMEEDFFIKLDMFTQKHQDMPQLQKDTLLQNKDQPENQLLRIHNPLKSYRWFHHHPLLSIFLKGSQTRSSKLLNLIQLHMSLLSQAACSTLVSNLSNEDGLALTTIVAPMLCQFLYSIYTFMFFYSTQQDTYKTLRGYSTHFGNTFHNYYIFGFIVCSIMIFVGCAIVLIEFGQKQYIEDSNPVIVRFVVSAIIDIFGTEMFLLVVAFIAYKLNQNISSFKYFSYLITKGYCIQFIEITDFYFKKSELQQKEQKKLQDITFKGDIQNKRREKLTKRQSLLAKQEKGTKTKEKQEEKENAKDTPKKEPAKKSQFSSKQ